MNDDYNDIDMTRDTHEAFAPWRPKHRVVRMFNASDEELRAKHPGAQDGDVIFSGARPGLDIVETVIIQPVTVETKYNVYEVKYNGQWSKKANEEELDRQPPGTKFREGPGGKKGLWTPDDLSVNKLIYMNFWRREDHPTLWTILFSGPATPIFTRWLDTAQILGQPYYAGRYRLSIDKGGAYPEWSLTLVAKFDDASPEAPSKTEYCAARELVRAAASAQKAARTTFTSGKPPPPDEEAPGAAPIGGPPPPPPAPTSYDGPTSRDRDDLPDFLRVRH